METCSGHRIQPTTPRVARRVGRTLSTSLAVALVVGQSACVPEMKDGATVNALAPGRPGTGNPTEFVIGHPESPTESPQTGGAAWLVPEGVTGRGGATDSPGDVQNRLVLPQVPGVGLDGGLGGAERTRDGSPR